jgi:DNA-binding NarL/FixJ family response regulator
MELVGDGRDLSIALGARGAGAVDVVLVDEAIAGISSSAARIALDALSPRAAVVVMGMGDPAMYADAEIAAGADGYWAKFGDTDALIDLVRAVGGARRTQSRPAPPRLHA